MRKMTWLCAGLVGTVALAWATVGTTKPHEASRPSITCKRDGQGRLVSVTDSLGSTYSPFTYTGDGVLRSVVADGKHTTTHKYDSLGNLVETITSVDTDEKAPIREAVSVPSADAPDIREAYNYDAIGCGPVQRVDAEGKAFTFTYDKTEHFDEMRDANGLVRTYTYDKND